MSGRCFDSWRLLNQSKTIQNISTTTYIFCHKTTQTCYLTIPKWLKEVVQLHIYLSNCTSVFNISATFPVTQILVVCKFVVNLGGWDRNTCVLCLPELGECMRCI